MPSNKKKSTVPILAYVSLALVFLAPIFLFLPMCTTVGLFTFDEYTTLTRSPGAIIYFIVTFISAVLACLFLKKIIADYEAGKTDVEKTNKLLKLSSMVNIAVPITLGLVQGLFYIIAMNYYGLEPESFQGYSPVLAVLLFCIGCVFEFSLLFYVIYTRLVEPKIHFIPFNKHQITLGLRERNLLTLVFALIGTLILLIVEATIPANLELGRIGLIKKMLPIAIYAVAYFIVIEIMLIADVITVVKNINLLATKLSEKDYTTPDQIPSNRSELGVIIQNMNNLKNQMSVILKEIGSSTQATVRQSDDLVANMDTTKENVVNISNAITSVRNEIENQSAGVQESNASIEQIIGNIRSLNTAIENQASGVTESSAAVEEMVANISSVTQILEKNTELVNELAEASDQGQNQVKTAVEAASNVLKQSEGILQASNVIQNIASQTNLLAMNAAIESAHAGEAGKGFAVVAEEIRKLAEQSSAQSKNIDSNLKSLAEAISNITSDIKDVQTAFGDIYELAQKVRNQESIISNAMEEQNAGNQQVLEAMRSINDSTTEVKDGSTEMLVGGEQILNEMSHLTEVTRNISENMNQIADFSQQISDAVTVTTASTTNTQNSLTALMQELSEFKL